MTELDARDSSGFSRRTVVRGAAWAVPVVSMAATAPAFAASPCMTDYAYALDWGNASKMSYTPPTTPTGAGTKTGTALALAPAAGASAVTVTFESTIAGTVTRTSTNLTVGGTNVGALGGPALLLAHDAIQTTRSNRQQVLITFSRAVTGLSFSLVDIDSQRGNWYDQVELTGTTGVGTNAAAFTQAPVATETDTNVVVWGNGSQTSPWRPRADNLNVPAGDGSGNKALTFTTPVKTLTLVYWNSSGSGNQTIAITDLNFTAKGC